MEKCGEIDKADMAIIDDVSQFAMIIITIIITFGLVLSLPTFEPIIAQTEEPKKLGGPPALWMTLYITVALWMGYAWGYKPLAALYKAESVQGRFLSTLARILRAGFIWGALLSLSFVACGALLDLFEGAAPVINLISVGLLLSAWFLIDYQRHAALAKAFDTPVTKPHPLRKFPLRNILKPFKSDKGPD